ncbi:signal peptide peptidase SppA [Nevskia sp.]|uniref:signal peptide peptidase SppA n=1 Tax=Nevskia sp. TaxID=1929292 RepID=UPI0025FD6477|nr:signal peptide peptidase SppA [Nevskia sp.]
MKEPRPLIVRLFSWIWTLIVFCFRAIVVISLIFVGIAIWAGSRNQAPAIENNVALAVIPFGEISDQVANDQSRAFLRQFSDAKPDQTPLRTLVDAIEAAASDSRIPSIVVKLDDMAGAGLPQLEEIALALRHFRATGKPVYAYGDSYDQRQYFLASQADEISLDPYGAVLLEGFSVYTNYFKDALDKLGVEVNIFRVGEFKSAVEPYERNDMSAEARTANQAWLGDLWSLYGTAVGDARKLTPDAANRYVAGMSAGLEKHKGDLAAYALEAGLVTQIETQASFRKRMIERVGEDPQHGSFRQIDAASYYAAIQAEKAAGGSAQVAVVVVQGEIVDGEGDETSAGGDTIAGLLDDARREDAVKAVLLRVNSPGGSVFASEKIRRGVLALQAAGKPVIASMSTLAASGGYWVSMDADQIWAEPTTITGSIGIFGLIPTIAEPLNKLGVHTDGVGTTPLAGAFRIDRPLGPEIKTLFQLQIEKGYRNFIEGVAKGRELPVAQVDSIARGRVWSGKAAKELGLVDALGGFPEAEAAIAELAGLTPGSYQLNELQPDRDLFKQFFGDLFGARQSGFAALLDALPATGLTGSAKALGTAISRFDDPQRVYAYCFCTPQLGGR